MRPDYLLTLALALVCAAGMAMILLPSDGAAVCCVASLALLAAVDDGGDHA